MSVFLPDNYEMPAGDSNYMTLEDGENVFRVLSSAIVGWEYWVEDGEGNRKPVRLKTVEEVPSEYIGNDDSRDNANHFWAFCVWNYALKRVQIMKITQKSIMRAIRSYVDNEKWGDPKEYDFVITKSGEKLKTKYSLTVNPKEIIDPVIVKMSKDMDIDWEAYYKGEDPFTTTTKE